VVEEKISLVNDFCGWLMLQVFGAFSLLAGCREGHPAHENLCHTT